MEKENIELNRYTNEKWEYDNEYDQLKCDEIFTANREPAN